VTPDESAGAEGFEKASASKSVLAAVKSKARGKDDSMRRI